MKSLEIWSEIKDEATTFKKTDEDASVFLDAYIEPFETLGSALSFKLSQDLAYVENQNGFSQDYLFQELEKTLSDKEIIAGVIKDLLAVKKRDPAATGFLMTLLFSKGFLPFLPFEFCLLRHVLQLLVLFHLENIQSLRNLHPNLQPTQFL